MSVLVIGAGVIGLTTGITLLERGRQVTIRADEIPGRTSLTAAAMWARYLAGPVDKVEAWSRHTRDVLTAQAKEPGTGVRMLAGFEVAEGRRTIPVVDMPSYLDYLLARFEAAGGRLSQGVVTSFDDLGGTVVNCTGIGARALTGDTSLTPVRGQLVILRNPGLAEWYLDVPAGSTEFTHFLPHGDVVIAGGVAHAGVEDLEPDMDIARSIVERCAAIEPKLKHATVLGHRAALRPARHEVRLEEEPLPGTRLVHNYGHGGSGISLSWGCAADVADLLESSTRG